MPHDPHPKIRPPRKTRPDGLVVPMLTVVIAVVVMILLFLVGAAAQTGRTTTAEAKPIATVSKAPGIGWAVRDGKFELVVSRVDCSRTTLGVEHLKRTAAGKYCVVGLQIRNIADDPQLFLGKAQKAYDAGGAEFGDDELAGLYVNRDTQTFLRKIDPGHKVTGKIVFDVPKATTLTAVELHDSPLSGGVRVTLR